MCVFRPSESARFCFNEHVIHVLHIDQFCGLGMVDNFCAENRIRFTRLLYIDHSFIFDMWQSKNKLDSMEEYELVGQEMFNAIEESTIHQYSVLENR